MERAPRLSAREWGVLLVLSGTIFLEGVDMSAMGVTLPSIRADLGLSTASLQWVVSAYVLGYGGFVLLGGRAADLLGRRRVFLAALTVFIAFSGLGGLASDGWMLIVSRFVTGVAAGFMTPAGLSIITSSFAEGRARNQALLIYAGAAAAGFSLGLVAGGALTTASWRWVFFAPVILAAALLPAALRVLPADPPLSATRGGAFDLGGALAGTAAAMLLVLAIVRAPEVSAGATVGAAAAGLAVLAAFIAIERRTPVPLIRLGILRSGSLQRANLGAMLLVGSFAGFQFLMALYLQDVLGWSALATGLALLPVALDAAVAPTVTPWLVNRFGTARVIFAGFLLAAAGYALVLGVDTTTGYAGGLLPSMVLIGFAFAFGYGPLTIAATDGVDDAEHGLASGLVNTSFQFGTALGLAAVAAVQISVASSATTADPALSGLQAGFVVPVIAALLGAAITATNLSRPAVEPAS